MKFDIQTAILGLAIGNLVLGLILRFFQAGADRAQRIPFLATGKLLQGIGWLLLYGRGMLPDVLSFTLGNIVLIGGTAYDSWAMYRISQRPVSRALQVNSLVGIITLCILATFLSAAGRIAVASFTVMIFFALGGRAILSDSSGNLLVRRHIGWSMWLMVAVISVRGGWAALAPEHFTLFAANTIQLITFATLYYLMLTNGFGMLLLAKGIADRELFASEERFRSYFEMALIGIAITSPDKGWLTVNAKLCEILGYTKNELTSMTWAELTHPDDLALDLAQFNRVMAGEIDGYDLEKRFIRKDGQVISTQIAAQCVRHPDRSINYLVALIQDITARKQAEQALEDSVAKYRFLTENIKDVIWSLDVETLRFLYVSPSVTPLRGYTPEEIMAEPMGAALTAAGSQEVKNLMSERAVIFVANEAAAASRFYTEELEQSCKDGSSIWTEVVTAFWRNTKTSRIEVHGVTRDITERKRVEAALRESEARYQDLYENAPDMYLSVEPQTGRVLQCNQTVVRLTGFEKRAIIGCPVFNLYHPDCLEAARQAMHSFVTTGEIHDMELQICRQDGGRIDVSLNASAVRDVSGQIVKSRSIWRDITDRKRIEQAEKNQRTLAEALRDTARALNSTLDFDGVLDEILKNVGRVVPIVSANVALLDDQGKLNYTHFVGYLEHPILEEELKKVGFSLEKSSIYKMVFETGQPVVISDTQADPRWIVFPGAEWIRSYAVMPIRIKNKVVGFLNLDSPIIGMYTPEHIQNLLVFADQAALAVENAKLYTEIQEHAITDELTGVINRRGLFQMGEREIQRAIRFQHPLMVIMFDIDHFKLVNDTYGHPIGDRILCMLAKCCQTIVRNIDVVARYGGDEFILLLTETDLESAASVAERLRNIVEHNEVSVESDESLPGKSTHVTISLGVTGIYLYPGSDNLQELIKRADQAMYAAKNAGRNQLKIF